MDGFKVNFYLPLLPGETGRQTHFGIDGIVKELLHLSCHYCVYYDFVQYNVYSQLCVPDGFGTGIIVPIVKNRLGDVTSSSN